jgi:oligopeptide/dipeptide ABC transporter ATP-binding protein
MRGAILSGWKAAVALLEVDGLQVELAADRRGVRLLEDVTLQVDRGEVLGIVGESGSGKSMLALAVLGLLPAGIRLSGGHVRFDGIELAPLREAQLNKLRGARLSMIFQEPMTALNPAMRVGEQVAEVVVAHESLSREQARRRAMTALEEVGLVPADRIARLYPHELSGGMRQRVMIAVATACAPDIIIADEPTTALDVTVQQQILALLRSVVDRRGCALILISHDIGVIGAMCSRVAVMYAGRVVEEAPAASLLAAPRHPYSRLLLDTYVDVEMEQRLPLPTIAGAMPFAGVRVAGCRFHPRCPEVMDVCRRLRPGPESIGPGHRSSCHLNRTADAADADPRRAGQ